MAEDEARTDWAGMLRDGLRLGLAPEAFWRLSVREWHLLTERAGAPALGREAFVRLAEAWPDGKD